MNFFSNAIPKHPIEKRSVSYYQLRTGASEMEVSIDRPSTPSFTDLSEWSSKNVATEWGSGIISRTEHGGRIVVTLTLQWVFVINYLKINPNLNTNQHPYLPSPYPHPTLTLPTPYPHPTLTLPPTLPSPYHSRYYYRIACLGLSWDVNSI